MQRSLQHERNPWAWFSPKPVLIPDILSEHDAIIEVAVFGAPREKWGETPDDLTAWVNARVGKQQRIAGTVLVAELPRNPNGKILKRELRRQYAAVLGKV